VHFNIIKRLLFGTYLINIHAFLFPPAIPDLLSFSRLMVAQLMPPTVKARLAGKEGGTPLQH
jgi:hypothetical protein